jgi:hypothetical protein
MSDLTDIAARTQRFRDAVRAFTPPSPTRYAKLMPLKDGIIELREKGASLRLIRELLATVDVSVSIDTIARFLAEVNGVKMKPRPAKQSGRTRKAVRITNGEQNAALAAVTEPTGRTTNSFAPANRSAIRTITHSRSASQTRTTSDSTQLLMNKQINLVINGKGSVGKSFLAPSFVQYLKDCGIAHCQSTATTKTRRSNASTCSVVVPIRSLARA